MFTDDDPGLAELRRIALAMPGAEEKVSHGRPTFRAGKIFATFGGSEKLSPGEPPHASSALIFMPETVELPGIDEDSRHSCPRTTARPAGGRRGLTESGYQRRAERPRGWLVPWRMR